jgi:hypothetical protein
MELLIFLFFSVLVLMLIGGGIYHEYKEEKNKNQNK